MTPPLIGLMGQKNAGKDAFAERLVTEHGFTRLAFADPLKLVAYDMDPWIMYDEIVEEHVHLREIVDEFGWDEAKQNPYVRDILKILGCAIRARVGKDVWVRALAQKRAYIPGPVVVTDVRFPEEADYITRTMGMLVRVVRPNLPHDDHESETALDARVSSHIIWNDMDLAHLHCQADILVAMTQERV